MLPHREGFNLPPRTHPLCAALAVCGGHSREADLRGQSGWWPAWVSQEAICPRPSASPDPRALLQGSSCPLPTEAPRKSLSLRGLDREHLQLAQFILACLQGRVMPIISTGLQQPSEGGFFVILRLHVKKPGVESPETRLLDVRHFQTEIPPLGKEVGVTMRPFCQKWKQGLRGSCDS